MLYDSDGKRVRFASERVRRFHSLADQYRQLETRIRRFTAAIATMNKSSDYDDVPEYAQALASLENRLLRDKGLLVLVNQAMGIVQGELLATPTDRARWARRRRRKQQQEEEAAQSDLAGEHI